MFCDHSHCWLTKVHFYRQKSVNPQWMYILQIFAQTEHFLSISCINSFFYFIISLKNYLKFVLYFKYSKAVLGKRKISSFLKYKDCIGYENVLITQMKCQYYINYLSSVSFENRYVTNSIIFQWYHYHFRNIL